MRTPSEHRIDGVSFDMEVQIFFDSDGLSPYVALAVMLDQEAPNEDNSNFISALLDTGLEEPDSVDLLDARNFFRDMESWEFF